MSFTDQKPRVVTEKHMKARWGGEAPGKNFRCYLCGYHFKLGDIFRWVYSPSRWLNFMTCEKCDGPDVLERWWKHMDDAKQKYWHLFDRD